MGAARRVQSVITLSIGVLLIVLGVWISAGYAWSAGIIPFAIGCSLAYLGWRGGRVATLVLGHALVVTGCYLLTWGIYLLPHSQPIPSHIFGRPLFWGLISIFGGICAIYHGFCNCVGRRRG